MKRRLFLGLALATLAAATLGAGSQPFRSRTGLVLSASSIASQVGAEALRDGGNAVDAAVATAFALAVTHPTAGNIGGGGFLVFRANSGATAAYDFRETAPAKATPTMFLRDSAYEADRHHRGYVSVGVPGTVAGLRLAWREQGKLPWKRLVRPAVTLARGGFVVSEGLARSLANVLPAMRSYPASLAQFSKNGQPYVAGDRLMQPVLAATLERIATLGPPGFYEGALAEAFEREMTSNGGLITKADLAAYKAVRRTPLTGTYRGYDLVAMPPPTSGGVAVIQALNVLEGFDLRAMGAGSATATHVMAETMRRTFADRAARTWSTSA